MGGHFVLCPGLDITHLRDPTRLKLTSYPLNGVRVISMSDCASQPSMMHRVVITDPENSNKMADINQPRNYSAFIERRNNNRSFP